MEQDTNQKNPVFLWDLHEVVFRKSWHRLLQSIIFFDRKREIARGFSRELFQLCLLHFKERLRLTKRSVSAADLLYLAEQNQNEALTDLLFQVCFAYQPIVQTVSLIKELKELGFRQHIGSNIPRPVFDSFKELHPEIFALFDYAHVVDVTDINSAIKKPDPVFFTSYLEHQKFSPKDVIFIDDKKRNITTARAIGIQAIHFRRPATLRKKLIDLKLLP